MLITKEVEMTWTHANKKKYIELGYVFTKYGDSFTCNVKDLSESSCKNVECECDYCHKIFSKKYLKYLNGKNAYDKDACSNCASKKAHDIMLDKYGDKNYNVRIAEKHLSEYNKQSQLGLIVNMHQSANKKNYILMPYIYESAKEKIGFVCKKHKEIGIQYSTPFDISKDKCNCEKCIRDNIRKRQVFSYEQVKNIIESNGRSKLISKKYTKASDRNLEILCYECQENTLITSLNKFSQRNHIMCKECRKRMSYGKTSSHWKGGITDIRNYLRTSITPWKIDSLSNASFKCDISKRNSKKLEVHHLNKNFKDIIDETFKIANIEIKSSIGEYTQEELAKLSDICLQLHYKYGLGVCLERKYHLEFHNIYGRFNNTLEQYNEYKSLKELKFLCEKITKAR